MNRAFSTGYLNPGNKIITVAVKITFRIAAGNRNFHPKVMSWSYLNRGSVNRIHSNTKTRINTLTRKYAMLSHGYVPTPGPIQPPKNNVAATEDEVITLNSSAIRNIPIFIEEYSVWYPATNSASASGRSNGTRLVSASADIKKIMNPNGWTRNTFHFKPCHPPWASTIFTRSSDPD